MNKSTRRLNCSYPARSRPAPPMKPAPPDFSFSFQKAVADWRKRHAIREDDVILLCLELFQIHQKHWDEVRHRDLPSFNEFRETINKLQTTTGIVQKES